ncbi:hypothetical protein FRACYDRAFT_151794, partial [Fragilariopsis cylindrus CCMP1102]
WFQKLYDQHNESGRYYHTMVHLWEMFQLLDILSSSIESSSTTPASSSSYYIPMAWAIFFHDVVYDPKSNQNEKDKKPLGEEDDDDDNDNDEIEFILQMQQYFLDIDMTVLGKRQNAYLQYASLIRKEFAFVPRDVYCTKRAEILETFLGDGNKKHIYLTKTFQEAFEERARSNLREEINLLRKNIIP